MLRSSCSIRMTEHCWAACSITLHCIALHHITHGRAYFVTSNLLCYTAGCARGSCRPRSGADYATRGGTGRPTHRYTLLAHVFPSIALVLWQTRYCVYSILLCSMKHHKCLLCRLYNLYNHVHSAAWVALLICHPACQEVGVSKLHD